MNEQKPPKSAWARYRIWILPAAALAWVLIISVLHLKRDSGGTTKGAAELLQIGALPVT